MSRFPKERFSLGCVICGSTFEVVKSRLGIAKFCSNACRSKSTELNNNILECLECKAKFKELATHRDQMKRNGADNFFCGRECFFAHHWPKSPIGTRRKCGATEYIFLKVEENKWIREHRLVAEKVIGRKLNYNSEPILHIDGRHYNNDPKNLYVCKDTGEMNVILKTTSAPYPVRSNLRVYL